MRLNYDEEDKVEVQMSPLIDCVFLLLIFFFLVDYYDEEVGNANTFITSFTLLPACLTTRAGEEAVIIAVDERKCVSGSRT